jgi:hypothetical protein
MDCSNEEIAAALEKPSANAARMAVERALVRLAREMRRIEGDDEQGAAETPVREHGDLMSVDPAYPVR